VVNLVKILEEEVRERGAGAPYLIPIGDRAEEIARRFQERQIDTQRALEELEQLIGELRTAEEARRESDFSVEGFAVAWLLQRQGIPDPERIGREMEAGFGRYPHWRTSAAQERDVRRAFYRALTDSGVRREAEVVTYVLDVLRRGR
jgi:type I restriction enzyme R subunit